MSWIFSLLCKIRKERANFAYVFLENSFVIVPSFLFYNVLSVYVDLRSVRYSTKIRVQSDRKKSKITNTCTNLEQILIRVSVP